MACHSCCRAIVRPASVVGALAMSFILSPKTAYKFWIGLRSRDFARQSITSISAFCTNADWSCVWSSTIVLKDFNVLMCSHKGLYMEGQNVISVMYSYEVSNDDNEISPIASRNATPYHDWGPTTEPISFTYTSISQAFISSSPHPLPFINFLQQEPLGLSNETPTMLRKM